MSDPRPQTQIEAEEANAAEKPREITQPEGDRQADIDSARAYAADGVSGAPGSEAPGFSARAETGRDEASVPDESPAAHEGGADSGS